MKTGDVKPATPPGGYRDVWFLAYPVIITMVSYTVMGFVDTVMVGQIGATELAAVGLAGILTWTIFSFFNGLLTSINTFVAQRYGAGDRKGVSVAAWQGIYIAIGSYAGVLLIGKYVGYLFVWMKPSPEVQHLGAVYTQIRLYGGLPFLINLTMAGFLRGIGDTKTPMWITIVANLVNIGLDYLLIFGRFGLPRLEIAGAAIATVVAGLVGTIIYTVVFLSKASDREFHTRSTFRLQRREISRILRIGLPMGVQFLLDGGSFTVFAAIIGRMGDIALAANTAAITLLSTSFMPLIGISMAATTLVGQYIGSNQLPYAQKSGYTAIKIGVAYTFLVAIAFITVPNFLFSMLTKDQEVIRIGRNILWFAAAFQLSDGFGICSSGALRGAGDTFFTMVVGIGFAWLFFLPLAYGFGIVLGYGIVGAWGGATIYIALIGIIYFLRFRSGRWEQIQI